MKTRLAQKIIMLVCFVLSSLTGDCEEECQRYPESPLITIITSVYDCDEFIEGFLEDIVQQTVFQNCELLVIDPNSPGNEYKSIKKYQEMYPNIFYLKLQKDPGIYGVWNLGAKMARSEFITNANTDDRLAFDCYEKHAKVLLENPDVDLVYSNFLATKKPNETMKKNSGYFTTDFPEFEPGYMYICLPNNHPMWRKSFHEFYGFFDESYVSAGDWEMWCRAVEQGAIFKKVPGVLGLYFENPNGISTSKKNSVIIKNELKRIQERYGYYFYTNTK